MNDLEPITAGGAVAGNVATIPTADLLAELARGLTLIAANLTRLGLVWAELERRGANLAPLRKGLVKTLPLIAAGLLAAESVVGFAGRPPAVLRALEGVPLDLQRRLAAGESVDVIDPTAPAHVMSLPLADLPVAAVRLAFGSGEMRSPDAQRLAFRPRPRTPCDDSAEYRYRPRYDREAGTIAVGRMTVQVGDLLQALAAGAGPDRPPALDVPEEYVTVRVRLRPAEADRFAALCRQAELPDWELCRKALRAFGLI